MEGFNIVAVAYMYASLTYIALLTYSHGSANVF